MARNKQAEKTPTQLVAVRLESAQTDKIDRIIGNARLNGVKITATDIIKLAIDNINPELFSSKPVNNA